MIKLNMWKHPQVKTTFLFILSLLCVNGMQGMGGDGEGPSWLDGLMPSVNYDSMAQAFRPIIVEAMTAQGAGFAEGMGQVADRMSEALADGMARGVGGAASQGVDQLFGRLNANLDDEGEGGQAIRRLFDGIFRNLANNFADHPDGHGREGVNNMFASFADLFRDGGEGNRIFREFGESMGRHFQEGGAFDDAAMEGFQFLERRMQDGGDADRVVRQLRVFVQRRLQEGGDLDQVADDGREFANRQARKQKEFFAEGGDADRATRSAIDLGKRNVNRFVNHVVHKNIIIVGGVAIVTVAGVTTAYYGTRFAWRVIERNWMRPKLIIESSKENLAQRIMGLFYSKPKSPEMVFSSDLEQRLNDIVQSTINIHTKIKAGKSNVSYRNLMLWGPPGTGKTMFAKRLARESGLEWAYMSGSSFAKFKDGEGIEALDELFKWANKSKGLLLFIDEADSFLMKRENLDPNSKAYQLLNNFLNYTGERSNRFMVVFATNHKDDIDSAMHRRIDDLVELPLPQLTERARVLALYRAKLLLDVKQNGQEFVDSVQNCLHDEKIEEIAQRTYGLSNGDLEGMIYSIKTDADITDLGLVSNQIIDRVVQRAMEKYQTFTGQTVQHAYA